MRRAAWVLIAVLVPPLAACGARSSPPPRPPPTATAILEVREGLASYYGQAFDGKIAASGVRFDMDAMVAAHPSYPFGTVVRITHLENGRSVRVRIVDRGPANGPRADGVIIDLSQAAAKALDFIRDGRARVRVEVLQWGRN